MISGDDIDVSRATWRKSSRSQGQGENCVEVARMGPQVAVRDSKTLDGDVLVVNGQEWNIFLSSIK
ncbi:DUF397 domain-containing protein [Sphaerisporangium sp. NPDC051011]|uniref:DUF397 domain-containing protein n=1 Tax=Sphaerisporangium sp. NPDC051011 TaxID=3155792 RepID=UPI0033FF9223